MSCSMRSAEPLAPKAFCTAFEWLSVARWSDAACCTSGTGDEISLHSAGTAAACLSRLSRRLAQLERTDMIQHCVDGSLEVCRTPESCGSILASATAMHAEIERDTSIASSHAADFARASEGCPPSCLAKSLMRGASDLADF